MSAWVSTMTPHGWRAGIAGDMYRERVRPKLIMRTGRWRSRRAMEQYIRDGLAQQLSQPTFRPIPLSSLQSAPYGRGSHVSVDRLFYVVSSSGDDSNDK